MNSTSYINTQKIIAPGTGLALRLFQGGMCLYQTTIVIRSKSSLLVPAVQPCRKATQNLPIQVLCGLCVPVVNILFKNKPGRAKIYERYDNPFHVTVAFRI